MTQEIRGDACALRDGISERLVVALARAHASGALAGLDLVSLGTNTQGQVVSAAAFVYRYQHGQRCGYAWEVFAERGAESSRAALVEDALLGALALAFPTISSAFSSTSSAASPAPATHAALE